CFMRGGWEPPVGRKKPLGRGGGFLRSLRRKWPRAAVTARRRRCCEQFHGARKRASHMLPEPIPRYPRRGPRRRKSRAASRGAKPLRSHYVGSAWSPCSYCTSSTLSYLSGAPEDTPIRHFESRLISQGECCESHNGNGPSGRRLKFGSIFLRNGCPFGQRFKSFAKVKLAISSGSPRLGRVWEFYKERWLWPVPRIPSTDGAASASCCACASPWLPKTLHASASSMRP